MRNEENKMLLNADPDVAPPQVLDTSAPPADKDAWPRILIRLRAEVGEDVFTSWFARIELDGVNAEDRRAVSADEVP